MQTILSEKHFDMVSAISTGGEGIVFRCSAVQLDYLATSLTKWRKKFQQEVRQAGKEDAAYQQAMEGLNGRVQRTQVKEELLELQDELLYHKGLL